MAFGNFNQNDNEMADMNVTPLVDVMLVLLIVFMIAMPVFTSSIQIQLPQSTTVNENVKSPNIIRVIIDADGKYYIADQPYHLDELKQELQRLYQQQKESVIAIRADQKTNYQFVAGLLDLARQVGISKIGFVTEVTSTK